MKSKPFLITVSMIGLFFSSLSPSVFAQSQNDSSIFIRKHVIKVGLSPFGGNTLEYENMFTRSISFNMRYTFYDGAEVTQPLITGPGVPILYRERLNGHLFMPELRYYFNTKNTPNAFYSAAFFRYRQLNRKFSDGNYDVHDSINVSYSGNSKESGLGLKIGKQWILNSGLSVDLFAGIYYNDIHINRNFMNQKMDNEHFLAISKERGYTRYVKRMEPVQYFAGVRIGFNFNPKELKNKLIDPPFISEKKNVLKIGVGIISGDFSVAYERFLGKRFSTQLSAGYYYSSMLYTSSRTLSVSTDTTIESNSYKSGYVITPSIRYYVPLNGKLFPNGLYLEPTFRYRSFAYHFEDMDTIPTHINYTHSQNISQIGYGLSAGYQFSFGKQKSWIIDVHGGVFGNKVLMQSQKKYSNSLAEYDGLQNKFSGHDYDINGNSSDWLFGIRVGRAF